MCVWGGWTSHFRPLSLLCPYGEAVKEGRGRGVGEGRQLDGVPSSILSSEFILAPVIKYLKDCLSVCLCVCVGGLTTAV